jgi:outer membrane protein assembly factor BamB
MQSSFESWKLVAFDRATGKERWSVDLPGEPVFNGLAPSSEGTWLLTLRDGSMVAVGE